MLFIYLALTYAMEEMGYIFSEGKQRFLTRNGVNIVVGRSKDKPLKFRMVEMDGKNSHNMLLFPVPKMGGNKVADLALNGSRKWHFYPKHGNWNQRTKFILLPGNALKIVVGSECIGVREDNQVVGETCRNNGEDLFQIFSWIPISQKKKVKAWFHRNRYEQEEENQNFPEDDRDSGSEDKNYGPDNSPYDSETSSSDYWRGERQFYDFDYDGGLGGGYGSFGLGMGSLGGRRRRYRRDEDHLKFTEDGEEDTYKSDGGKDYREERMFRRKRMGNYSGHRKGRHHKGSKELDGGFLQGRDMMFGDLSSSEMMDYFGNLQEYDRKNRALRGNPPNGCGNLDGIVFAEGSNNCNTGGPGENEICRINKTTTAFRKMVGIPI
ncbi:uncharacterized protein Eint_081460 [Encephalitozoon intestinalis ATCC 50506]|uniref:Uncharacterized protein n=1 Tax=Encephalitozoon intestinalis (strain ATCC 50506) TaxID=876142 RepID=E0S8E1_ENCIT|nr:uncharacterized protein Eint_081460 [Encephalitozoon intestinalis ATCC 50506]ADM12078.2 hypothetical protein Eint_081460 [Encephalitozoon intestinalis ATCC 50506]UTX45870.1 hypothetical protein GPK93_08g14490 [Encephalitozoon intestinalis]